MTATTTPINNISTSHTTAIDNRGHFFQLPTLGLPDPGGEWVVVKAAVGPIASANVIASRLFGPPTNLDERQPRRDCKSVTVTFQGAVWMLPRATPQNQAGIEVFAIKAKRLLPDEWPDRSAVQLLDNDSFVCLEAPDPRSSTLRSLEELEAEYGYPFAAADAAAANNSATSSPNTASPSRPTAAEQDIERTFSSWELMTDRRFRPEWFNEVSLPGPQATVAIPDFMYDAEGVAVGMTYALRREGDDSKPADHEFRPMPLHAMVPGLQRVLVNARRMVARKGPLAVVPVTQSSGRSRI